MAKQSSAPKEKQGSPTMDAIYDPKTYEGFEVTGDWRQGFSVVLNGMPMKFTRNLGVDTQIDFEVWADVTDGTAPKPVLLVKTTYEERASRLMQEFSQRSFDKVSGQNDELRAKAVATVMWAAGVDKGEKT
jgi:hypothetical protein